MATYKFTSNPYGYGSSAKVTFPATTDANGNTTTPFRMYSTLSDVTFMVDGKETYGTIDKIDDNGMTALVKGKPVKVDINTIKVGGRKSRRKSRKNKSRRYRRV